MMTASQPTAEVDADGRTALHHAALSDDTEVLRQLAAGGGDVNKADEGGWAPLHVAASAGRLSAVEVLLMSGADVAASTSAAIIRPSLRLRFSACSLTRAM